MKTRVAQVSLSRYKRFSRTKTEKTVKHEVVCAKSGIGNTWNVSPILQFRKSPPTTEDLGRNLWRISAGYRGGVDFARQVSPPTSLLISRPATPQSKL